MLSVFYVGRFLQWHSKYSWNCYCDIIVWWEVDIVTHLLISIDPKINQEWYNYYGLETGLSRQKYVFLQQFAIH